MAGGSVADHPPGEPQGRARPPWQALCLLGGLALVGCPSSDGRGSGGEDACNLGPGALLAETRGSEFDAVALLSVPEGALAAWSTPDGTFVRRLDPEGAPVDGARQVEGRCAGGLALAGGWLACLRPDHAAYLVSLKADGNSPRPLPLGTAGRDSQGIALVEDAGAWWLGYHDGTPGDYGVWLVEGRGSEHAPRVRLSDPRYAARAPTLATAPGGWLAAWTETRFVKDAQAATRIVLQRSGDSPVPLGETPLDQPAPRIGFRGERHWLAFRSRHTGDRQAQLYTAFVGGGLKPQGNPRRVGRANTLADPVVLDCPAGRFAAMSRVYGGERYAAVHPLDAELRSVGGGYQYYESGRDYVQVAAACSEGGMWLLAAERKRGHAHGAQLKLARLRCE